VLSVTIGKKVVISVIGTFLLAFLIIEAYLGFGFQGSFNTLEKQSAERNVTRAINTISTSINNLAVDAKDWADWDDTYNFAQDGNESYITEFFSDAVYETKHLNLIVVLDRNGHKVYGKAYDLNTHGEMAISQELDSYLTNEILIKHADNSPGISGLIILDN
jgi:sensor domain CHASE-containing protein